MKDLMMYKEYVGSVHFDSDDLLFYGKIEFIRALVSYEATDAVSLKASFENAVDDYLAFCKEKNIQPEIPLKGSLNVRVGTRLHRKIAIAAQQQHVSINKFITKILSHALLTSEELSEMAAN